MPISGYLAALLLAVVPPSPAALRPALVSTTDLDAARQAPAKAFHILDGQYLGGQAGPGVGPCGRPMSFFSPAPEQTAFRGWSDHPGLPYSKTGAILLVQQTVYAEPATTTMQELAALASAARPGCAWNEAPLPGTPADRFRLVDVVALRLPAGAQGFGYIETEQSRTARVYVGSVTVRLLDCVSHVNVDSPERITDPFVQDVAAAMARRLPAVGASCRTSSP
ncbi:MAG TPA: hypothetical protein VGH92_06705 [Gaiellaceae bacterium]